MRLRSARPSDRLGALRRFYADALGLAVLAEWQDHEGIDGLVLGEPGSAGSPHGGWQVEFVHVRGEAAPPPPPGDEHLLVFYVDDRATLAARAAAMDAAGCPRVQPHNPYWARHGVTFRDPDGYHVVIALPPGAD